MTENLLLRQHLLPKLLRATKEEVSSVASTRATFGLGLTPKDRRERVQTIRETRFCVNFRLPANVQSHVMNALVSHDLENWLSTTTPLDRRQHRIFSDSNLLHLECSPSDVVSRLPPPQEEEEEGSEPKSATHSSSSVTSVAAASGIHMKALSTDPSLLYELLGLERPLTSRDAAPSPSSLGIENSSKKASDEKRLVSSSNGDNSTSNGNNNSLRLFSAVNHASLRPWELQHNLSLHGSSPEFRRSFFRIGSDSLFSLASDAVPRPIRLVSMNFVSFEADSALMPLIDASAAADTASSSSFSSHHMEEAWYNAIQCSKRALEACSTLMHERAIVSCVLLRRRDNTSSAVFDPELDHLLRGLRGAFGSADVVPLVRRSRRDGSAAFASRFSSSVEYDPVLVLCSESSSGKPQRSTSMTDILPHSRKHHAGILAGGGNAAQLDFYRSDEGKKLRRRSGETFVAPRREAGDDDSPGSGGQQRKKFFWKPRRHTLGHKGAASPTKCHHQSLMPGRKSRSALDSQTVLRRRATEKKLEEEAQNLQRSMETEEFTLRNN